MGGEPANWLMEGGAVVMQCMGANRAEPDAWSSFKDCVMHGGSGGAATSTYNLYNPCENSDTIEGNCGSCAWAIESNCDNTFCST